MILIRCLYFYRARHTIKRMKKNVYNKIGIMMCMLCLLVLVAVPTAFAEGEPEPPAQNDIAGAEPTQADDSGKSSPPPVDSALIDKASQDPQVQPTQSGSVQAQASGEASSEASAESEGNPTSGSWLILALAGVLLVVAAGVVYYIVKRKQKQ